MRRSKLLHVVVALSAVLGACSPAQPGALEVAPPSTKAQPLAAAVELSPELPLDPQAIASAQHNTPTVAAGNGMYLLVWMEVSSATGDRPDILAVRVRASDGARLDVHPLVIASGVNVQFQPAVAFDGTNFLVVYTEIGFVPAILGTRVRASDGAVLDSPALLLSRTPMGPYQLPQLEPAVAFDGTNYLVSWSGPWYDSSTGAVKGGIQAIRVRPSDGSCIESSSTLVAAGSNLSLPRVAYTNGTYLVTWHRNWIAVEAARISASTGQVLDPSPLTVAAESANARTPAVAAQNGEFLVAWVGVGNLVWARRVRASDGALLGSSEFAVGPSAVAAPEATFDGTDYWITWQGTLDGTRKALAARVSPSGGVAGVTVLAEVSSSALQDRGGIAAVSPGRYLAVYASYDASASKARGQLRLMTERSEHVSPELAVSLATPADVVGLETAVAEGNGLYLVVWSEVNSTTSNQPDIFGVRVRASDGTVLDASPLRIGGVASTADIAPAVAFDGTNFLVLWEGIGYAPVINGARVRASDGAVLDTTPLLISHPPTGGISGLPQLRPSAAFDGTNYLVAWDGFFYDNGPVHLGVMATRVRPDGSVIESISTVVSRNGDSSRVAYTNGNYLVTWSQGQDIAAARISAATGQVLDVPAITLAATAGSERYPAVAARDGEFLVVWIGADNGLWGRRLGAADGVKLGSADLFLGADTVSPPEATFDGLDYRVVWEATRDGMRKLLASRVSAEGEIAADAEIAVSLVSGSASTYRPGLASASPGHLLTTYTQYDAAAAKSRARMRFVTDEQTPTVCEPTGNPTLVLNGFAPLTLECGSGAYSDPGAQAFDSCGSPIAVHAYNTGVDASGPGPNMRYEGTYSVSYSAWDAMGHTVNASRQVIVDDRTAPTLTLKGAPHMTHTCGSQWVDPGVQATDACYGDISPQVRHTGEVNGWAAGTYAVTYALTDAGGNSATPVTRTVDVVNCPW